MKSAQILVEEAKKEGLVIGEEVAAKAIKILENALIRIPLEAEEVQLKALAPVALIVLSALKPSINNLIDFNHDGKIGA
jgi:hypothetical protein